LTCWVPFCGPGVSWRSGRSACAPAPWPLPRGVRLVCERIVPPSAPFCATCGAVRGSTGLHGPGTTALECSGWRELKLTNVVRLCISKTSQRCRGRSASWPHVRVGRFRVGRRLEHGDDRVRHAVVRELKEHGRLPPE